MIGWRCNNLNIGDVARHVRDKVKGFEATRFNMTDRRIPILVRLKMEDRETVEDVRNLVINPGGDRPIPLSAVADVSLGEGPSEVRRIDGAGSGWYRPISARAPSVLPPPPSKLRCSPSDRDWPGRTGFRHQWSK